MVSIIFNLLRLNLWLLWSIIKNVPNVLEKNAYSVVYGMGVLYMSVRSSLFIVLFKSSTSLLLSHSIHYWEGVINVSLFFWVVYYSFKFCQFLLHIFYYLLLLGQAHVGLCLSDHFTIMESSSLSRVNTATQASLMLHCLHVYFFQAVTCNPSVFSNIKCVSCTQYTVGLYFWKPILQTLPFSWNT